jgi:hypothetical protein
MATNFRAAMSKMAILGQSRADLTDCSGNPFLVSRRCQAINYNSLEVIPTPKPVPDSPSLPAGKTPADIEAAVSIIPRTRWHIECRMIFHCSARVRHSRLSRRHQVICPNLLNYTVVYVPTGPATSVAPVYVLRYLG